MSDQDIHIKGSGRLSQHSSSDPDLNLLKQLITSAHYLSVQGTGRCILNSDLCRIF